MRHALDLSPVGAWGDPRSLAGLSALAERSGWDGVFVEDYVVHPAGEPCWDVWPTLAAMALATQRVQLATMVTPMPARLPWQLAGQAATLHHLSGGRFVLGVGSGDPQSADVAGLGPPMSLRERADRLDEALALMRALWSGEPVSHEGRWYRVDGVRLGPPSGRPHPVPVWVGGALTRDGPVRRALAADGACLYRVPPPGWEDVTPDDVRALRRRAALSRPDGADGFVVAVGGRRRRGDLDAERAWIADLAAAGCDWWHEYVPPETPVDVVRELVAAGPLR